MANAKKVLEEAVQELNLFATSGGRLEELQELSQLVFDAYYSEDGLIDNARARILHPTRWTRLGINPT